MLSFILGLFVLVNLAYTPDVYTGNIHAIYVSVLEIEQVVGEKEGNIRIKVFANDLEDAIFNKFQRRIDLLKGDCNHNKELASDYFNNHLQIYINGDKLDYKYMSCEINDNSIWFNYSFSTVAKWTELKIEANYLMELFPTQSNVVSVKKGEEKRMFRLTNEHTSQTVTLK